MVNSFFFSSTGLKTCEMLSSIIVLMEHTNIPPPKKKNHLPFQQQQ